LTDRKRAVKINVKKHSRGQDSGMTGGRILIAIGSDHGGVHLKGLIIEHLRKNGFSVQDFGTCSTDSVDYPDYAQKVAVAVSHKTCERGIVICGTGIGVSIAANKISGIRAALCTNEYMARMSRKHNDANILALGERIMGTELAIAIVDAWIQQDFEGERHIKRVNKILELEKNSKEWLKDE
jgi:ribose 5-phosphate isomerase B